MPGDFQTPARAVNRLRAPDKYMAPPPTDASRFAISIADSGLWRQRRLLEGFLGKSIVRDLPLLRAKNAARLGWGRKPSGLRAEHIAARTGQPVWLLEDGFLRSRNLGHIDPPLSIVVDDLGIYYDCSRPSRLERLICETLTKDEEAEARELILAWRRARVSKYNFQPEYAGSLPEKYVLVVDQTRNDHSIRYGGANAASFDRMLKSALSDYPDHTVIVKTHPDVLAGKKNGYFDPGILALSNRIQLLAEAVHPVRLIEHSDAVYAVTSQVGFEALIWGKPVRTFGMPFYAGWGLTEDIRPAPIRRQNSTLYQLCISALLKYAAKKLYLENIFNIYL
ncbi:capsular polysaccharide export protein, LipB/KpsS family [Stappia albiluteola]|nr:hypothetical protein [Stappia albiluteola]